jgi:hypothetical protein
MGQSRELRKAQHTGPLVKYSGARKPHIRKLDGRWTVICIAPSMVMYSSVRTQRWLNAEAMKFAARQIANASVRQLYRSLTRV